VRDSRSTPVENATAELTPAYSASKTRIPGTKQRAGTYAFDLPRELMDAPLRLMVTAPGLKAFDKTQYWGQKGKAEITLEGTVATPPVVVAPVSGGPPIEVSVSPTRALACDRIRVAWVAKTPKTDLQIRYRLLLPNGEVPGTSSAGQQPWAPLNSGETVYADLVESGTYTFVLEYAPRGNEQDKRVISTQFAVTWQDPVIRTASAGVDWTEAAGRQWGRDSVLSEGFRRVQRQWNDEAESRLKAMGLRSGAGEVVGQLQPRLKEEQLHGLLSSALESGRDIPPQAFGGVLTASVVHDLALEGYGDIVRAYRDSVANRALTMAAITSAASAFFAGRAQQVSAEEEMERQIAETKAALIVPPAVQQPAEVAPQPAPADQKEAGVVEEQAVSAQTATEPGAEGEGFGTEGFQVLTGFSAYGPELAFGSTIGPTLVEGQFVYQLLVWNKDEDLWNTPAPGGYMAGLRVFPVYAESFLPWRFKFFLGAEYGMLKERNGKNVTPVAGEPTTGYWQWADAQLGVRVFIFERLSVTAWGGLVVWKSDEHSMLTQYPKPGYEDKFAKYVGNVTIGFTW
jgi:hypothetical protein